MLKKCALLLVATVMVSAYGEPEYYGCQLPQPGKDSSVFLFLYDEAQKGLLEGYSGVLAMWPYGKVPHKCGVAAVYDLNQKNPGVLGHGVKTGALQFTCQRVQGGTEGISVSTITFTFDRVTKVLSNAVYSDVILNVQVKDKYIASSVPEPRRFICDKLDPKLFEKPATAPPPVEPAD